MVQVPTATLTGIFRSMSTDPRRILLGPSHRRGRERKVRRRRERIKYEREGEGEQKKQERREEGEQRAAVLPMTGGVMSHRPVILKLPFNIPTASVVTRKEVRGHTR